MSKQDLNQFFSVLREIKDRQEASALSIPQALSERNRCWHTLECRDKFAYDAAMASEDVVVKWAYQNGVSIGAAQKLARRHWEMAAYKVYEIFCEVKRDSVERKEVRLYGGRDSDVQDDGGA